MKHLNGIAVVSTRLPLQWLAAVSQKLDSNGIPFNPNYSFLVRAVFDAFIQQNEIKYDPDPIEALNYLRMRGFPTVPFDQPNSDAVKALLKSAASYQERVDPAQEDEVNALTNALVEHLKEMGPVTPQSVPDLFDPLELV